MTEPAIVDLGCSLSELRAHRSKLVAWTKSLRSAEAGHHEIEVGDVLYRFHKKRTQRANPSAAAVAAVVPSNVVPSQPRATAAASTWAVFSGGAVRSALLAHLVGDRCREAAGARLEAAILVLAPGATPVAAPKRLDAGANSRICNSLLHLLWKSVKGTPPLRKAGFGAEEIAGRAAAHAEYDRNLDAIKDALTADATAVCRLQCVQSLVEQLDSHAGAQKPAAGDASMPADTAALVVTDTATHALTGAAENTAALASSLASSPDSHMEMVRAALRLQS
jgi:hypothetical protein